MEIGATLRARCEVERCGRIGEVGTSLKHIDQRDVVDHRPAVRGERRASALYDRELGTEFWIDVGFPDRKPVDQMIWVLLDGAGRGSPAIRDARRDHDGVTLADLDAAAAEFLIEQRECEFDR